MICEPNIYLIDSKIFTILYSQPDGNNIPAAFYTFKTYFRGMLVEHTFMPNTKIFIYFS